MGSQGTPTLKLYTNHGCPWAHRVHIALAELDLPFEEEIIDLSTPRTPEYLKINPRGLVPSLAYGDEIITESAIVAQFLADLHPSHLLPTSDSPGGALKRARVSFFVDTYVSKVNGLYFKALFAKSAEEAAALADEYVAGVVKEVEPLLGDAKPFFGGSSRLTLAEVLTGSLVLRIYTSAKHGLLPASLSTQLEEKAPNFHQWAQHVIEHPSVLGIFDEEKVVANTRKRLEKLKAAA